MTGNEEVEKSTNDHLPRWRCKHSTSHSYAIGLWLVEYGLDAVDAAHRLLQSVQSGHFVLVFPLQNFDAFFELSTSFAFGRNHLVGLREQLYTEFFNFGIHLFRALFGFGAECPFAF
jgi:hypothetical protein